MRDFPPFLSKSYLASDWLDKLRLSCPLAEMYLDRSLLIGLVLRRKLIRTLSLAEIGGGRPAGCSLAEPDGSIDNELETIETESDSEAIHDLPVLVFEGLPEPRVAQSEEDLIESILSKTAQIPSTAVRKAVRLPIKNNGRTLVMVEMDTIENEMKVLKKETTEALTKDAHLDHVGIRTAKYKELWKMVEQLSVAKQFIGDPPEYDDSGSMTMTNDDENDAMIIEEKDSSLI